MNSFSDFNIKPKNGRFVGDKIKMFNILNRQIIVHDYLVKDSKFKEASSPICLHLQIELEGEKRILFTGSKVLTEMIESVPGNKFPFTTTIIKERDSFKFT